MGLIENVTDSTPTQRDLGLNNFHQRHMISPVPGKNWKYYFKSGLNLIQKELVLKNLQALIMEPEKVNSFGNSNLVFSCLWGL